MQPYFFPYIGYFQLINAVDIFVEYDDVNFINRGWINRNNILFQGRSHRFTLPLQKATQNKKINEINVYLEKKFREKILKTLEKAYKKSPYFPTIFPIIEDILLYKERRLSDFLHYSLINLANYMDLDTNFIKSSDLDKDLSLPAQDRLVSIVQKLEGSRYINTINGRHLYSKQFFRENGIELFFLKTEDVRYKQFNEDFIPSLSIIDVLMFNDIKRVNQLLLKYKLV